MNYIISRWPALLRHTCASLTSHTLPLIVRHVVIAGPVLCCPRPGHGSVPTQCWQMAKQVTLSTCGGPRHATVTPGDRSYPSSHPHWGPLWKLPFNIVLSHVAHSSSPPWHGGTCVCQGVLIYICVIWCLKFSKHFCSRCTTFPFVWRCQDALSSFVVGLFYVTRAKFIIFGAIIKPVRKATSLFLQVLQNWQDYRGPQIVPLSLFGWQNETYAVWMFPLLFWALDVCTGDTDILCSMFYRPYCCLLSQFLLWCVETYDTQRPTVEYKQMFVL